MDSIKSSEAGGSLQISSDVIDKIARLAAKEIEGVVDVAATAPASKKLLNMIAATKPVQVELNDEVADIEISLIVAYGSEIPELAQKVQRNIKSSVQNMTSITVGHVDVVVAGIAPQSEEA